ncbi:SEC10/PgrA surface exclusion domain-containing protein [Streptococcus hyointestinalis]|uniref:SEC10/PgrA surface exclusion domain-containing protein n=1 Tax=Streptococcus hyointestinalis TaxID=1337 RepID=UPI003D045B73
MGKRLLKTTTVGLVVASGVFVVNCTNTANADEVASSAQSDTSKKAIANTQATSRTSDQVKEELDTQKAVVETATQKVETAKEAVQTATKEVETAQTENDNAQSAVDKAQENANNATAENIAKAETNVTTAEVAVANAENNVSTAEKAQSAAQDKVNTQETVVANAETAVNQAKTETENAQAAVNQAQSVLNGTGQAEVVKAQENAKNAVNADKKAVSQAEDNVTSAKAADEARQKAIEEAQAKVTTAETANTNAEKVLKTATEATNKGQTKAEQAKSETANAQTAVDQAQAVLDGTGQAEIVKAQQEAQSAVSADKEAVRNAETSLTNAKAADVARQNNIDNAQADVTTAEKVAANAKTALDNATNTATNTAAKVEAEQADVEKVRAVVAGLESEIANANTITLPAGYAEALKQYLTTKSSADKQALATLAATAVASNTYKSNSADQAEVITDINNLTEAQREDLTLFAVDLINQVRKVTGGPTVVANKSAMDFANEVANTSTNLGHDTTAIPAAASKFGLISEQGVNNYENLSSGHFDPKKTPLTMNDLKKAVYTTIVDMLLDDDSSSWGHARSLAGLTTNYSSSKFISQYVGVDVSVLNYTLSSGSTVPLGRVHILGVSDGYIKDSSKFNTSNNLQSRDLQAELTATKSTLATEQSQLTSATLANNQAQSALREAQTDYDNSVATLTSAHTALAAAQATPEQTTTAQAKLDEAQAQKALDEALTKLDTLKAELATATSYVETAKAGVATAQNNLAEAKQTLSDLKNAPVLLADAKAKLAEAQAKLEDAKANLVELTTDYEAALKALDEAKAKQAELQAVYDHLLALEKDNVVTVLPDGTVVAVPKATPTTDTLPKYTIKGSKSEPKVGLVVTQTAAGQKVTYSRVERSKALPETGEKDGSVLAFVGGVIATIGLAGVRRKRIH